MLVAIKSCPFSLVTSGGSFNNYVDKMRGKCLFFSTLRVCIKTVHAGGGGVKKGHNSVHVVVEWPLACAMCSFSAWEKVWSCWPWPIKGYRNVKKSRWGQVYWVGKICPLALGWNRVTGYSFSKALILASKYPKYDKIFLFNSTCWAHVEYLKLFWAGF